MKPPRVTGSDIAVLGDAVNKLVRKFDYPDENTRGAAFVPGGGGGMAHYLIVSTSEPRSVQEKADFVVDHSDSAAQLQIIFDALPPLVSIWMAGQFNLEEDVTAPQGAWVRGLGPRGSIA